MFGSLLWYTVHSKAHVVVLEGVGVVMALRAFDVPACFCPGTVGVEISRFSSAPFYVKVCRYFLIDCVLVVHHPNFNTRPAASQEGGEACGVTATVSTVSTVSTDFLHLLKNDAIVLFFAIFTPSFGVHFSGG